MSYRNSLVLFVLLCVALSSSQAVNVTASDVVTNWTKGPSPLGSNTSSWSVSGTDVAYTVNTGSAAWSNFTLSGDFVFKSRIWATDTDDDRYGILFGTDAQNNYRISWEKSGLADNGLRGLQFVKESGDVVTALSSAATTYWATSTVYEMTIYRVGAIIGYRVVRVSDSVQIAHAWVTDTTFMSGSIGLWNQSQITYYNTIQYYNSYIPQPGGPVIPEPNIMALIVFGLFGAYFIKRSNKN